MTKLNLSENFISQIWENKSYYSDLMTTNDEHVSVIDYGSKNTDAGPDYKNARVNINGKVYTGSIEIHRSVKDWHLHNHKNDKKYSDLILHVVLYGNENEELFSNPVVRKSRHVPTVILSNHLTKSLHEIWKEVINKPSEEFSIPCYPQNLCVPAEIKKNVLKKLGDERLKIKTEKIKDRFSVMQEEIHKKVFWEKCLFELICKALGYSKNKDQFSRLAMSVELEEIKNMNLEKKDIDAVFFGLAGFLNDLRFKDAYILELKDRWSNLKNKLRREVMDKSEWNFFRLRPANFPTVRIGYASGILFEIIYNDFFKRLILCFEESLNAGIELKKIFKSVTFSDYWNNHYNFGKVTGAHSVIGDERISDITVNVILPLLNYYALVFKKEKLKTRVNYFFNHYESDLSSNEITKLMEAQLNISVKSLSHQQALIQLHDFYCINSKCNECEIGRSIQKKAPETFKIILY